MQAINSIKAKTTIVLPLAILVAVLLVINIPDLMGAPLFALNEKVNIILTSVLAMFAVIQGYSAYIQVEMEKKRNQIKAVSDELEKAYGPIHAVLSRPLKKEENKIELLVNDKIVLDEKFSTYRSMFSSTLIGYWEKNIRNLDAILSTDASASARDLLNGHFSIASGMVDVYKIPFEFENMFNQEYMRVIEKQRRLLNG